MWSRSLMRGGRLQDIPNIVIWLRNVWYFGKLVAEESGRIRVMVATEGWTMLNKSHSTTFKLFYASLY